MTGVRSRCRLVVVAVVFVPAACRLQAPQLKPILKKINKSKRRPGLNGPGEEKARLRVVRKNGNGYLPRRVVFTGIRIRTRKILPVGLPVPEYG
jgi:hypothetical protein